MKYNTEYLIHIESRQQIIHDEERHFEVYRQIMTGTDRDFFDSLAVKAKLLRGNYQPFRFFCFQLEGITVSDALQILVYENTHMFQEERTGFLFEARGFLYFSVVLRGGTDIYDVGFAGFGRTTIEMGSGLHLIVPNEKDLKM